MRLLYLIVVLGVLEGSGAAAASEPEAADPCEFSRIDAFDPDLAPDARQAAVEALVRAVAHPACGSEPDYLLGLLYRYGPELPGNPLPRDAALARELLGRAARDGRIQGYAELAEMALADGDAREAMQWTQGYLLEERRKRGSEFDEQGYNADLLLRAAGALKRAGLPAGGSAMDMALKEHLARERSAREADRVARPVPETETTAAGAVPTSLAAGSAEEIDLRVKRRPADGYELRERLRDGGYAEYLLEVQPDGRVSRIVVQSFSPTWRHALVLRQLVEAFEFHPHLATEPQVVRIPVVYGYVGPDGPKLKRRR
jgi:hypothetical protein